MLFVMLAGTLAGAPTPTPVPILAALPVDRGIVRVGDVAIADRGRALVVLRLPRDMKSATVTPSEVRTLVANRVPGARFSLRYPGALRIVHRAPATGAIAKPRGCSAARVEIPAGTVVTADQVAASDCGPLDRTLLGYDRVAHAAVARRDIPAGAELGAVRVADAAPVATGQRLVLRTAIGPVMVERAVSAVQPARAGARLFARTDDGAVVAARVTAPDGARR